MSKSLRIGLCAVPLASVMMLSQAQPVDAERMTELSGVTMMVGSFQLMRDICTRLYPSQTPVIHGFYEVSAVPAFAKLFNHEVSLPRTPDRDTELESLGMTESEASNWCLTEFPTRLDEFDERYADRIDQIKDAFESLEKEVAASASTPPRPQPPQDPRVVGLFASIVDRSNLAYETGDWSALASLYEPGTFDCWEGVPDALQFAFLSIPPLSPNATFTVSEFTEYLLGGRYEFTNASPTHLMEVSDEISSPGGRCGLEKRERWPRHHFFLVQRGSTFELTHYCPSKEAIEAGDILWQRPLSAIQAAANISLLTEADWNAIAKDIQEDRYSPRMHDRFRSQYGFGYEETNAVIDYVCDPSNTR